MSGKELKVANPNDERRLQDGARALDLMAGKEPETIEEIEEALKVTLQGAGALQSMDDLLTLQDRIDVLRKKLKKIKEGYEKVGNDETEPA